MTRRLTLAGLGALVVGALGLGLGAHSSPRLAAGSYLIALLYVFSIAVGALFFAMIGHVTGSRWFVALRRLVESVLPVLTLLPVLFVPVALAVRSLYAWADPGRLSPEDAAVVAARHAYLNVPFFVGRGLVFLALWAALGEALRRWSLTQDTADDTTAAQLSDRMRTLSAAGLPLAGLALTFASFDWLMSLEPRWTSTVYGVYLFAGAMTGVMPLMAVLVHLARRAGALPPEVAGSHVQAIGKLVLTFVIFWAYIAFCQLLLVWIANLPEEVPWYLRRSEGRWVYACVALVVGHFALPLALLLSWRLKRSSGALAAVGAWLLVMHYLDVYWLVGPALGHTPRQAALLDIAALLAVGGAAVAWAAWRASGASPVPHRDPLFALALDYEDT